MLGTLLRCSPPKWNRYIEPFAGSACYFFALRPPAAILGDFNEHLVDMYAQLHAHPRLLSRRVKEIPWTPETYYEIRQTPLAQLPDLQRAAHFVYLNRRCFNGVYRTNRHGMFNVPLGSNTGGLPSETSFYRCSIALRSARLMSGDFQETCRSAGPSDFVYLDPPYSSAARTRYGEYGYDSFCPIEIDRLLSCIRALDDRGAYFLLSYTASDAIAEAVRDTWDIRYHSVRRHVAGFAKHRGEATEILVANYELPGTDCREARKACSS
jgi:DNA adenine methylase